MNLPRLFDDKGELINVDASKLDPATRARLEAIRSAYAANSEAQTELDAAYNEVTDALATVEQAESFHNAHWPRQTFHDLWLESFGRR